MSETRGRQPITPPVSGIPVDRAQEARQATEEWSTYMPPGQLPLERKSPDFTARWVRFRLKNADDPKNIGMMRRDGYVPVPYEHRAEVLMDPDSVLPSASGNIEIGDVVLCRRSAIKSKMRKDHYAQKTADQIRGAKNQVKKAEDKRYPNTIFDSSETSFEAKRTRTAEFAD
jgi:hypothetical protein